MSMLVHIKELKKKHAQLEGAIFDETSRPLPNTNVLAELKHKKLVIKDEIARLMHAS